MWITLESVDAILQVLNEQSNNKIITLLKLLLQFTWDSIQPYHGAFSGVAVRRPSHHTVRTTFRDKILRYIVTFKSLCFHRVSYLFCCEWQLGSYVINTYSDNFFALI